MKSAAAIVNWNSGFWLRKCVAALLPDVVEIVVVDNASEDDSLAQAGTVMDSVRLIRNDQNRGFAAGVNQGFSATAAPYVLVLNPDAQATAGAVERLEQFLDAHPKAGAVGGYVNEKYLPRRIATPWTVIRENIGMPVVSRPLNTRVEQVAAAALMIRRAAHEEVGGFDERFHPAWYEDVDFCKRLREAGWEIHFTPEARFLHEGGYSAEALGASAFTAAYYRNQLRYVNKHFGAAAGFAVRASLVAGMIGRMVAVPSSAAAYSKVIAGALGGW